MNRWASRPTGTFTGRHAPIGTSMVMDCFCRTDLLRFRAFCAVWLMLPLSQNSRRHASLPGRRIDSERAR